MQLIKKTALIIVFAAIFHSGFSQKNILGEFIREDASMVVQDIGTKFVFNLDSTFIQTDYFHLGHKKVFTGKFLLNKEQLILYYKPSNQINKNYQFLKRKQLAEDENNDYLFVKINLANKNLRKSEVELLIHDNEGKLLMGFSSDENGEFPFLSLFDSKIEYFIFSSLDYQELKIPAKELFGYHSKIMVTLDKSLTKYSQRNDTINYLITSFEKNKVELKNIKTEEEVILMKN